jgi:catechol 2,3-dioxygenase-like lactoylglutathione lyase family enzyme
MKMIKAIEHFSFTVSSLEESLDFFCDKLGLEATPIEEVDHPDVKRIVGMPDARLRISLVKLPGDRNIELIQYMQPKGKPLDLTTSNTGVAHIAFEVSDIIALYKDLSSQGITFLSPPVWTRSNDGQRQWGVCYLKGPDNITFELIEERE